MRDIWMGLCLVKSTFCCSDYNLWIIYEFIVLKKPDADSIICQERDVFEIEHDE